MLAIFLSGRGRTSETVVREERVRNAATRGPDPSIAAFVLDIASDRYPS